MVTLKNKDVTLNKIKEIGKKLEKNNYNKFKAGILKRVPGFYYSYDLDTNEMICPGYININTTIKETLEYVKK